MRDGILTTSPAEAESSAHSPAPPAAAPEGGHAPGGCLPPLSAERAEDRLRELLEADAEALGAPPDSEDLGEETPAPPLADLLADQDARDSARAILGGSDFLRRICIAEPRFLAACLADDSQPAYDAHIRRLLEATAKTREADGRNPLMERLRALRRRVALLCALGEIRAVWSLEQTTEALSRFADVCLDATLAWLLADAHSRGDLTEPLPVERCGLTILGMGKYGARELNYSSDIDLIALYAPGRAPVSDKIMEKNLFVRITRDLAQILQTPTALGHVFRVDLRLRPDAGSSAVAISVPAAESYYESVGRNWERAAFIKASVVAGDKDIGIDFLAGLRPFVWRKFLDAATIRDIRMMKEQTHALKKARDAAAGYGYDIKRGAGGIRAIEFFVQAQQLIAGGKDDSLRAQTTSGGLNALATAGWIDQDTARALIREYHFLRMLEHRLQMMNDEQTHALPRNAEDMTTLARFAGYEDGAALWQDVGVHLARVEELTAGLFGRKPGESEDELAFPALEDDPDTLEKLAALGFRDAKRVSALARNWAHGRTARAPSLASDAARARITALLPDILRAASTSGDADASIANFDALLQAQPTESQLASLLESNPKILRFLMRICSSAPRLAGYIERNASALATLLEPQERPDEDTLAQEFQDHLAGASDFAGQLERLRERVYEERFALGMQLMNGAPDIRANGARYAELACAVTRVLLPAVVSEEHRLLRDKLLAAGEAEDDIPEAETPVVVALGKMGSAEMSPESDLDLITIYDEDMVGDDAAWFQRVTQKLIAALSMPTVSGKLFTVDMRLRPFGASGPIATSLRRFVEYQRDNAWTWEHMALTRARVVAGDAPSRARVADAIREILVRRRNPTLLVADVADMRARMWKENPSRDPWELKHARGGMIDMEFVSQYLQLAHAHDNPRVLHRNNRDAFAAFAQEGILPPNICEFFVAHWDMLHGLTQMLRLCVSGKVNPEEIPSEFRRLLARAGGAPDFAALQEKLPASQERAHQLFTRLIDDKVR